MDIRQLLSPQIGPEPPAARQSGPGASSSNVKRKAITQASRAQIGGATTSNQTVASSKLNTHLHPSISRDASSSLDTSPRSRARRSPSLTSSSLQTLPMATHRQSHSPIAAPLSLPVTIQQQNRPIVSSRHNPATAGMDALANVASIAQAQQAVQGSFRAPVTVYDTRELPETPDVTAIPALQKRESQEDVIAIQEVQRRARNSSVVPDDQIEKIAKLLSILLENPYAYQSHLELIALLHQSLIVYTTANVANQASDAMDHTATQPDPKSFPMLPDLRQARRLMSDRFAVGESLWIDWISDETLLASSLEQYVELIELCRRSIEEEPRSTRLWWIYATLMSRLSKGCLNSDGIDLPWSEEEKQLGQEIFSSQVVLDTWLQGAEKCRHDLQAGNMLWDAHVEMVVQSLDRSSERQRVDQLRDHFVSRLQQPHRTWDQTFQAFSSFVSNFYPPSEYERLMAKTNALASVAKNKLSARQRHEAEVLNAEQSGNRDEEWIAWNSYATWEANLPKKFFDIDLCCAVYERALLKLGYDSEIWEDYIYMIFEKADKGSKAVPVLPVLSRATRHCPWSGNLWAQYLLSAERGRLPYNDIEGIKHRATQMGVLDMGGVDEVLKVYVAWCGLLARQALSPQADEDDQDVAELGIRTAIESMKELGERKYGREYVADPTYRLERLYINYLNRVGLDDSARRVWEKLEQTWGSKRYQFWFRWYRWEMIRWGQTFDKSDGKENEPKRFERPRYATGILRKAVMKAPTLDNPEEVFEHFLTHCEDYEDADEVQDANKLIRKQKKILAQMRQREAEQAAKKAALQAQAEAATATQRARQPTVQAAHVSVPEPLSPNKRKRDGEEEVDESSEGNKRIRQDDREGSAVTTDQGNQELRGTVQNRPHRDREHNTIVVHNLPPDATELNVRRFFQECGQINSLKLVAGNTDSSSPQSTTATLEFETYDDVLAALTKNRKYFDAKGAREWQLDVRVLLRTTVWVTNFPELADEKWLREKFDPHGEIMELRLPSLKYNTARRFCYIQFRESQQAQTACDALDGKPLSIDDTEEPMKLVVKISDPTIKEDRKGALYEGREVYIKNIDWSATEHDLRQLFEKYGSIEKVRIPKNPQGKSKGFGYVSFSSLESARASLVVEGQKFKSRVLSVVIADPNPKNRKPQIKGSTWLSTDGQVHTSASASASRAASETPQHDDGDHADATSSIQSMDLDHEPRAPSAAADPLHPKSNKPTHHEIAARTISLLNLSDKVSAPQISKLCADLSLGPIKRVTLVPLHGGAKVEFEDEVLAGKAMMALEGQDVGGRAISVGPEERIREGKEFREEQAGERKGAASAAAKGMVPTSAMVRRPVAGMRGGGKLGVRRRGMIREGQGQGAVAKQGAGEEDSGGGVTDADTGKCKSNADFKAMIAGGKQ